MKIEHENEDTKLNRWINRSMDGLSVFISLGMVFSGPIIIAMALVLAVLTGDAMIIGMGLLTGAAMGAIGALAMMWCLAGFRKRRVAVSAC